MQQARELDAVAAVGADQPFLHAREPWMRVGPGGELATLPRARSQRDQPQIRRLRRALAPDHGLIGAASRKACHGLILVGRAVQKPGCLPRQQVPAVEERSLTVWRRTVAAQEYCRAVLADRTRAIGVQPHHRGPRVAICIVFGKVKQNPVPARVSQVAHPGGEPPAVPVVLGQQQASGLVQVGPAQAPVGHVEGEFRL